MWPPVFYHTWGHVGPPMQIRYGQAVPVTATVRVTTQLPL